MRRCSWLTDPAFGGSAAVAALWRALAVSLRKPYSRPRRRLGVVGLSTCHPLEDNAVTRP